MSLEVKLKAVDLKAQSVEGRATMAKANAATTELVAKATKVEASRFMAAYKELASFRDEVNEAIYDAFEKGLKSARERSPRPSTCWI